MISFRRYKSFECAVAAVLIFTSGLFMMINRMLGSANEELKSDIEILNEILAPRTMHQSQKALPMNITALDERKERTQKVLPVTKIPSPGQKKKLIIYWNTYFGDRTFEIGLGDEPFQHCRVKNCETTTARSRHLSADAIIFHLRNVDGKTQFPSPRIQHQRYIFYLLEHPWNQWNDLKRFNSVFNWTMTYRRDSDIPVPYGKAFPKSLKTNDYFLKDASEPELSSTISFRNKTKMVAWFVSNCGAKSGRGEYVEELRKHVDVDVFGQCGDLVCPAGKKWHQGLMHPHCYTMLESDYKFYLSFESNICTDYVTEKLFNILNLRVVPVVYGAVNYSLIAPPHSVIDINNFKSPNYLADHLKAIAADERAYNRYFDWKKTHYVKTKDMKREAFCDLCEKLNSPRQPVKILDELDRWWGKDTACDLNYMKKLRKKGGW